MQEIRKPVVWYEWLYEVSNLWKVRGLDRYKRFSIKNPIQVFIDWVVLKPWPDKRWYPQVVLQNSGYKKTFRVHKLVARSFIWECPEWYQVNHIDGDKNNNCTSNLEYCSCKENIRHAFELWLKKGNMLWKFWKHHHSSKKVFQYDKNGNLIWEYR